MVQFSLISYRIKMLCIDVSLLMITQIFSGLFFFRLSYKIMGETI